MLFFVASSRHEFERGEKKKVIRNEKVVVVVVVVVVVGRKMYIIIHSRRKKKRKAQPLYRARKKGTVYRQCSEFEIRDEERNI